MITVEITDSLHYPLTNLQTRTTDTKGNTIIPINKKVDFLENVYVIADDSNLNSIKTSPTQIVFTVTDSIKSKSYHFVLYSDECKCHVYKLEGPEKIIF
jgi:hypothetical protein